MGVASDECRDELELDEESVGVLSKWHSDDGLEEVGYRLVIDGELAMVETEVQHHVEKEHVVKECRV